MGGFLIGLSTFQAEFDFGVLQYDQAFQPMFIALAAGIALVCARRGSAPAEPDRGRVLPRLRGIIALLVGPVWGETTPAMPPTWARRPASSWPRWPWSAGRLRSAPSPAR